MRAAIFHAPGDVRIETVPDPALQNPSDAIVRITYAAICGSDLWPYRGLTHWQPGWRLGHEWIGIVEETGPEVRTVKPGDYVLAPFVFSDGSCEFCLKGLYTSCINGTIWGKTNNGGQAEAIRVPFADGTLVALPPSIEGSQSLFRALLSLTDVMGTGHHAALSARVMNGDTIVVIGDGPVGLCSVLAAKRLGAKRIISVGHHNDRLAIARQFGATDTVISTGKHHTEEILAMADGKVDAAIEGVGTKAAMDTATKIVRPGGNISYVGVPHGSEQLDLARMFANNITLRGGVAPVRAYIPTLLPDVLAGKLDPSPIFNLNVNLEHTPDGYTAMDTRSAVKVVINF